MTSVAAATTTMAPSAECMEEQRQWAETESMMAGLFTDNENESNNSNNEDVLAAQAGLALLTALSAQPERLRSASREISTNLSSDIENEKQSLSNESNQLSQQLSFIQELESQISELQQSNADMISRRREAEQSIPLHRAVASEQLEEMDEIQSRHVRKLPKIKRELSLHALMTNIKWDYSRCDVLAGEVSIPSRSVHKRFVIEKEELSEFEIAERLWAMIEG
eukprot:CAMPEP_0183730228 /NCGR_PEP_ID=MMETSP0737-20130205/32301_1 /TAXON_ID=385413 /ORGANISM="Thalassiosira miniscula, Strain CCMP1093" /LENGTH=222 /DNA_ID=CAMNT_0025962667 /DNA_START=42 /DNA_END=710 /DNA_ORIENTATION=-